MSKVTDLHDAIRAQVDDVMNNWAAYQSLLAGAFAEVCEIDPRECQVIYQSLPDGTVRIWYEALTDKQKNDRVAALHKEVRALRAAVKHAYDDGYAKASEECAEDMREMSWWYDGE